MTTEGDILIHGHMRKQRIALKHHADIAVLHPQIRNIAIVEMDFAGGRIFQSGDHPQRRRLAATGWTQQRDQLSGSDIQIDILDRGEPAEPLADGPELHLCHVV